MANFPNLAALLAQQPGSPNAAMPGIGMIPPSAQANMIAMMRQRGVPGRMPQVGGGLPFGSPGAAPFSSPVLPQPGSAALNSLGSLQAALPYGR
jgi:hypothetical protein